MRNISKKFKHVYGLILSVLLLLIPVALNAELRLAGVFSNYAVLQRGVDCPIWGWADPGQVVQVEFAGHLKTAQADSSGRWQVRLPAMAANPAGQSLSVRSGDNRILRVQLLIGDVWLCSGQSNMAWTMRQSARVYPPIKQRIPQAKNAQIRLLALPQVFADAPIEDVDGVWKLADAQSAQSFSAIGYLFGETIQREVGVPIGMINASRGGTWIENWLAQGIVEHEESYAKYRQKRARDLKKEPVTRADYNFPGSFFHTMIHPIIPYALKGVLWYQGEGNVWEFSLYDQKIVHLIQDWRKRWGQPQMPFILSELAPFNAYSETAVDSPRCRFGVALAAGAQRAGHAWTITITDGGEQKDIHPRYKEIPAERFSAVALNKVYGKDGIAHGPKLASWSVDGDTIVVDFSSVGAGLEARAVNLDGHALSAESVLGFEIAGADQHFQRVAAKITGPNQVTVTAPDGIEPVALRYAWAGFPLCNLYNSAGFATYPFRTDDWAWPTPKKF
jgi:sialate O-acetylesterase